MLKMNYIRVIACLGLLFGTLVEIGAVPADVSPIPESKTNLSLVLCKNCSEATAVKGAGSTAELSQLQAPSDQTGNFSSNASSTAENDVKVAPSSSRAEPTTGSQSHSDVTNTSANNVPNSGVDSVVTSQPRDDDNTPLPTTTTVNPSTTPNSTVEPTTPNTTSTEQTTTPETTSTEKSTSTTVTPVPTSPTTSAVPSTSPTVIPTKAAPTTQVPTDKPAEERRFDGPSFIGGIVFALGVTAIAFVAWKFYKARTERNYHTL